MKKIIAGMLALVAVLGMAACSKKGDEKKTTVEEGQTQNETIVVEEHDPVSVEVSDEALDIAQKAMEAKMDYHFSGILSLVHEDYTGKVAAIQRTTVEEMKSEYDVLAAGQKFELEKDKGAFVVSGELGAQSAIQGEELTELQERYEKQYSLTVTEAVRVEYTLTTEFESGPEAVTDTMVIVLIDDCWYLDLAGIKLA